MSSGLVKHSVLVAGHRTSVSLEPEFWQALQRLALSNSRSVNAEIGAIDAGRGERNLSSAIRLAILSDYEVRLTLQGAAGS
jgi:predicted DNA-binding ribbon-helix-helix protein